jgi:two-component system, cell cycle sensor histidine kinase and response regulator CckA
MLTSHHEAPGGGVDVVTEPEVDLDPEATLALLRALFAASKDPIAVSSQERIKIVNRTFLSLFGYDSEEELIDHPALELVTPEERDAVRDRIRRRAAGEEVPSTFMTRGLRRDGTSFEIEVQVTSYQLRGQKQWMVVIRDLTAAETAARAVRQSEDFYRALFEVNTAVKLLIDPRDGSVVDANGAAVQFYGWPLDVLRTMRISEINTLTPAELAAELESARSGGRRYFRFRHRLADGEIRHVEVHTGPVEIDGRGLLLSIIHDVTERDQLEEQLRQAQKLEAIGRLAGGIAHDFNNLLTIMLTSSQLIGRAASPGSPIKQHAEDLTHAARRAADLTRQLLAFSRRQVLQARSIQLNDVVERMESLLKRTLGASIAVRAELGPELPAVRADSSQIEQVVMNLALNARDAMPRGGRLTLRTGAALVGEGTTPPLEAGRYVTLTVTDNGEGMDAATRERIFEPFFTTKPTGQGTGLGLATVYGIVVQSGGHVTVTSTPGQGTEFVIYLPESEEAPQGVTIAAQVPLAARTAAGGPVGRPSILIVDDVGEVRTALVEALYTAGFKVTEAVSADAALALPANCLADFDAIVSDVVMPGQSGIDFARILLQRRPSLPILLVSGDLRDQDASALPSSVRFLQKPFAGDRLVSELMDLMGTVARA